jgi:hypothetical protein
MDITGMRRFIFAAASTVFVGAAMLAESARAQSNGTPIPDLSGTWGRNMFNFSNPESGAGPVQNSKQFPANPRDLSMAIEYNNPVGDHRSSILKPEAAEAVRKAGEATLRGKQFPSPSTQCALYTPPYGMSMMLQLQIVQTKAEVLIVSPQDQSVRHIRLNQSHPQKVVPSWLGDSIGHYQGNTLVVDTIGFKVGPLSVVDRYGTPFSEQLHLVERFQRIDAATLKLAVEQENKENVRGRGPAIIDQAYATGIKVDFTVEDPGVFTMPWSASVTYQRAKNGWEEIVCAENVHVYYDKDTDVPQASQPDF